MTAGEVDIKPPSSPPLKETVPRYFELDTFDYKKEKRRWRHLPTTASSPPRTLISEILCPLNTIYNYLQSDVSRVGLPSVQVQPTHKHTHTNKKQTEKNRGVNVKETSGGGQMIYGEVELTAVTAQSRKTQPVREWGFTDKACVNACTSVCVQLRACSLSILPPCLFYMLVCVCEGWLMQKCVGILHRNASKYLTDIS